MAEELRRITVAVEIETNKITHKKYFHLGEEETREELAARVKEYIEER